MLTLEGTNLDNFRKMIRYIPEGIFPSIFLGISVKDNKPILRFTDIDINQSLVVNIETELIGISPNSITEEGFRVPLSKNIFNVIKNFNTLEFEDNSIIGRTKNKEVRLSLYVNDSDEYEFPKKAEEMLEFTKIENKVTESMEARFVLTKEEAENIYSCLEVIDKSKNDSLILSFNIGKKSKSIIITTKDHIGNSFSYTLENITTDDTFKTKYDDYFLSILKILKTDKDHDSFNCIISNLMFGTDFVTDEISVMLAVTVFEKIK